jgi:hypothetical protein
MLKVMNNNYEAANSLQKSTSLSSYKPTSTSSRPINRQHHLLADNIPSSNKLSASTSSSANMNDYDNYKHSPRSSYLNHHLNKLNHENSNKQILAINKSSTKLNDLSYNDSERYKNNRNSVSVYNEQVDDENRHKYEKQLQQQAISLPPQPQPLHRNISKVNRNYLLQMNKKFRQKISANVSGTKFEIGKSKLE